jgi:hypothetical protein
MNLNDSPRGGTMCLNKAGLAIGDGAKTGVAIQSTMGTGLDFMIDGIVYNHADAATNLPFTAAAAQGLLTKCLYLVQVDKDGTVSTVKGTAVLTADLVAKNKVLEWPVPSAGCCPIGAVKIAVTTSYNFTAGTTALDAAGVTATYYDLAMIPVNPLTA